MQKLLTDTQEIKVNMMTDARLEDIAHIIKIIKPHIGPTWKRALTDLLKETHRLRVKELEQKVK